MITCFSKKEWVVCWPNFIEVVISRGLFDHCLISLMIDKENLGPKSQRLLKFWGDLLGYKEFVQEKWQSFQVHGWSGCVLKEKFKLLNGCLKNWQSFHYCRRFSMGEGYACLSTDFCFRYSL